MKSGPLGVIWCTRKVLLSDSDLFKDASLIRLYILHSVVKHRHISLADYSNLRPISIRSLLVPSSKRNKYRGWSSISSTRGKTPVGLCLKDVSSQASLHCLCGLLSQISPIAYTKVVIQIVTFLSNRSFRLHTKLQIIVNKSRKLVLPCSNCSIVKTQYIYLRWSNLCLRQMLFSS